MYKVYIEVYWFFLYVCCIYLLKYDDIYVLGWKLYKLLYLNEIYVWFELKMLLNELMYILGGNVCYLNLGCFF